MSTWSKAEHRRPTAGGGASRLRRTRRIRVRPTVQGAVLVLDNKTGRILAMVGGFSYPLSQLNRTWQTQRQPGSAIKPITYLTALQKGLQPNTLVLNDPITLPPIGGRRRRHAADRSMTARGEKDYWSPRNADGGAGRRLHDAPRSGEFGQHGDRTSARRRHRCGSREESR